MTRAITVLVALTVGLLAPTPTTHAATTTPFVYDAGRSGATSRDERPEPSATRKNHAQHVYDAPSRLWTAPQTTQTVTMGRNMADRVIPYAESHGYGFYKGTPRFVPRSLDRIAPRTTKRIDLWFNKRWIKKQMRQGNRIVDIGEPPGYAPSDFYRMELDQVDGYWNYVSDRQP